jgi:cation-transporting ATPase F
MAMMQQPHVQPISTSPAPDAWHALPLEEVAVIWSTPLDAGLTQEEATVRLRQFGPNEVTARHGRPAWLRFLLQFHQPLMYTLLVAASVTVGLGEYLDALIIFGVVFVNAVVGFIQESRAEHAIESLARLVVVAPSWP